MLFEPIPTVETYRLSLKKSAFDAISTLSSKENLATLPNTVNGQFSRFFIVFRRFWSELLLKLVENFKVPYGIMLLFPRWKKIKELFPAVGNEWKKYINISPNKRIEWAKRTSEFMVKYKYIFWMSDRRREIIPLFFFTEGIITLFHMAPCLTKEVFY